MTLNPRKPDTNKFTGALTHTNRTRARARTHMHTHTLSLSLSLSLSHTHTHTHIHTVRKKQRNKKYTHRNYHGNSVPEIDVTQKAVISLLLLLPSFSLNCDGHTPRKYQHSLIVFVGGWESQSMLISIRTDSVFRKGQTRNLIHPKTIVTSRVSAQTQRQEQGTLVVIFFFFI